MALQENFVTTSQTKGVTAYSSPGAITVVNSGNVTYNYTVNPANPNGASGSMNTNTVSTSVTKSGLTVVKSVDKTAATIGEIITYTVVLSSAGNVQLTSVNMKDTIPSGGSLVANSVAINGSVQTGATPGNLAIGTITAGGTSTITFQVKVDSIPGTGAFDNSAYISYNYTIDPANPGGASGSLNSNTVTTSLGQATLTATKYVNRSGAGVGDSITYYIGIKNIGTLSADSVVLIDTIPTGATFVSNSVTINGITQTGGNPAPANGVSIGSIAAGQTTTVGFTVVVASVPPSNSISNIATVGYKYSAGQSSPQVSALVNTNTITTSINQATLTVTKTSDKVAAQISDTINYTVAIANTGNTAANNVKLLDTIPTDSIFVSNSVKINNVTQSGSNPNPPTGISVGTISAGSVTTVGFAVTVNSSPSGSTITNKGTVTYNFTADPSIPNGSGSNAYTNTVSTSIVQAGLSATKSVDKTGATLGDTITYTVVISNGGNVQVTNVNMKDTIPNGGSLVANSVTINGSVQSGATPVNLTIGTIAAGGTSTITFQVKVDSIPGTGSFDNSAFISYNYTIDPANPGGASGSLNSNTVTTSLGQATLTATKYANKVGAGIGDTVIYYVVIKNTGTLSATSVVLIDTIPTGSTFLSNSVTINGTSQSGANPIPPSGVSVGTIPAGQTTTVTFSVAVASVPPSNSLSNIATVGYKYSSSQSSPQVSALVNTNTITTSINQATLSATKTSDKVAAQVSDTINYTIAIANSGNTAANNVKFLDTIPTDTTFVANSFKIDNVVQSGSNPNPPTGATIGTINAGSTVTVGFAVTVNSSPSGSPITNSGKITYNYTADPSIPNGSAANAYTNSVSTSVVQAGLSAIKSVDKVGATLGDVITYTVVLSNGGNVQITNISLKDTIPNGGSLVNNSIAINGTTQSGATISNLAIGNIAAGATTTVIFKVSVDSIPTPSTFINSALITFNYTVDPSNPGGASGSLNTNSVTTSLGQATLVATKSANKIGAAVGEVVIYSVNVRNTGNLSANSVVLIDTVPTGMSFTSNSVTLNGVTQSGANPNPPTGITIGTLASNQGTTVSFRVTVNTIPTPNTISNVATVGYKYTSDPSVPNGASGVVNSNNTTIQVNQATLSAIKAVDKLGATIGDEITYTVAIKNLGNVDANNTRLIDTIPQGTTFVANSVTLNGVTQSGVNPTPSSGVTVGTISSGNTSTVSFKVTVTSIPSGNSISNSANITYSYTVDPSSPNGVSGSANTGIVTTAIGQATLTAVKSVNKTGATIGEDIQYTIVLRNGGNISANNIAIIDTVPQGVTFKSGSLTVNGAVQAAETPTSLIIPSLLSSTTTTISFLVTVVSIPSPSNISNSAFIAYKYTADPANPNGASGIANTNAVSTSLGEAKLVAVKSCDKTGATLGDTVTYTIELKNTGNIAANTVIFKDTIPFGMNFVSNSVKVNSVAQSGVSPAPPTGISVGTINAGSTTTIIFKTTVVTIPSSNSIENSGIATYQYTSNPAVPNGASGAVSTNTVTTYIASVVLGLVKSANKSGATIGDNLTYTVVISNPGNVAANNVLLIDTIPSGTSFVANSVTVNSGAVPSANPAPPLGISVGNIDSGASATVTFQVTVESIPSSNDIKNSGYVSYKYTLDPSVPNGATGSGTTNIVTSSISRGSLTLVKSANKNGATVGEQIDYTVALKNDGNVSINNIIFIDTIPDGTSFVMGSLKVNGIVKATGNVNPPGYIITQILANQVTTLTYKANVDTIPAGGIINNSSTATFSFTVDPSVPNGISGSANSNSVSTAIGAVKITAVKSVDKAGATVGEILTYTVGITNSGNVNANNVSFIDTIPDGTSFEANSVFVDGINKPNIGTSAPNGVTIASILAGSTSTIVFKVKVNSAPTSSVISNSGVVNYAYTVDPSLPNGAKGGTSTNTITTAIGQATLSAVKSVDKKGATLGDILKYSIALKNSGNIDANNVVVIDTVPDGTSFVANSLEINSVVRNGVNTNPPWGVDIGTVAAKGTTTVTFKVRVDAIPSPNTIKNSTSLTYKYTVDPNNPNGGSGGANSNTVTTTVGQATLLATKQVDKNGATVDDQLTYTIVVKNSGNIEANSVVLIDTIPEGVSLVSNSLKVNGVSYLGISPAPPLGGAIGNIPAGQTSTITFKVLVVTVPGTNPIPNKGTVTFKYTADPSIPNGVTDSVETNTVNTIITKIDLDVKKSADKSGAAIGDEINYFIDIRNPGNSAVNNVVLIDTIPDGGTFIPDSVTVGGVDKPAITTAAPTGVDVGSINPGDTVRVAFRIMVTSIPKKSQMIVNSAYVAYQYTLDPSIPNGGKGNKTTNEVQVSIGDAKIIAVKTVDKIGATLGEEITYNVGLRNSGNVPADNVMILDTVPSCTEFVANSLKLNGIVQAGATTNSPGYNLGNIPANTLYTVSFKVKVVSLPNPNVIINNASIAYQYTVDPSNPGSASGASNSNDVETVISQAVIEATKSADKSGVTVGDILQYTINLKNTGNIKAEDVKIKDTIPNGAILVSNSVKVNGVTQTGASPQPTSGILMGKIEAGETAIVTFNVEVLTVPSSGELKNSANINFAYTANPAIPKGNSGSSNSNEVITNVGQPNLSAVKSSDKIGVAVEDTITYTVVINNSGNLAADEVFLKETIPSGTFFVPNSATANGVSLLGADPNPPSGMNIGKLEANSIVTVSFKVTVITVPAQNPITSSSVILYNYTSDPSKPQGSTGALNTNIVKVKVGTVELKLYKSADKKVVKLKDIISYSIALKNSGNISANNILLIDTIPDGTEFVENSVKIGNVMRSGVTPQPPMGVNLGAVGAGSTVTVGFQVVVVSIPDNDIIENTAVVAFEFSPDPSIPNSEKGGAISNSLNIPVKQAEISAVKSVDKESGGVGGDLSYTIVLKNSGNILAENVTLIDTIPVGTVLIPNSVKINGVSRSVSKFDGSSPLSVGVISPGDAATINFGVTITTIPNSSQITNRAVANFRYTIDSTKPSGESGSTISNEVITSVKQAIIDYNIGKGLIKSTDKPYATLKDVITYRVALKNTGNVDAKNVVLFDTIPTSVNFVSDSVERNGQPLLGETPNFPDGINVGDVRVGNVVTISFKVTIDTVPSENPIENNATVSFGYYPDPMGGEVKSGGNSNTIKSKISYARISTEDNGLLMEVDKGSASVGSILTYSVRMTNTGNVVANNVIFSDIIPPELKFVADSVTIDGITQQGDSPITGVPVGRINPNETKRLTFKGEVNNLGTFDPVINKGKVNYTFTIDPNKVDDGNGESFTNEVKSGVKVAMISASNGGIKQTVDRAYVGLAAELTYTVILMNTGNVVANNVIIYDAVPSFVELIPGSIVINDVPNEELDASNGIIIGDVEPLIPITVTYKVKVFDEWNPIMKKVSNNVDVYYEYSVD